MGLKMMMISFFGEGGGVAIRKMTRQSVSYFFLTVNAIMFLLNFALSLWAKFELVLNLFCPGFFLDHYYYQPTHSHFFNLLLSLNVNTYIRE